MLEGLVEHLIVDPLQEVLVEQVVMDKPLVPLLKMELPIEVAVEVV
jgi:hypothetical protein